VGVAHGNGRCLLFQFRFLGSVFRVLMIDKAICAFKCSSTLSYPECKVWLHLTHCGLSTYGFDYIGLIDSMGGFHIRWLYGCDYG